MRRVALVLCVWWCGCATAVGAVGSLPAPPSAQDLAHDGSPQQRQALWDRYAAHQDGDEVRVGHAIRPGLTGPLRTEVNRDLASYLGEEARPAAAVPPMALVGSGTALMAAGLCVALAVMPLPWMFALGWIAGVELSSRAVVRAPVLRPHAIPITVLLSLLGTVTVSAVVTLVAWPSGALFIAGLGLVHAARSRAEQALHRAVEHHNQTLLRRLDAAAKGADRALQGGRDDGVGGAAGADGVPAQTAVPQ